ncbi:MAG: phage holin [Roseburia sp.]|nr:phage holin [Roseburia sp.]
MNIKVRVKNPVFWVQIVLSILTPILAYAGITAQDLTTWAKVWELLMLAFSNPYVLAMVLVSVWNTLNDPTTKGITDSERAMQYTDPQ